MKGKVYGEKEDRMTPLRKMVMANYSEDSALASGERSYAFSSPDGDEIMEDWHGARP
jgi:hypothetical protein